MNGRRIGRTALRVLQQLHHDPRTIGLILVIPSMLVIILRFVFDGADRLFAEIAPLMLGIFPFVVMFVVTSIVTLRERTAGTLERLMTMPMARLDLIAGYGLAFAVLALLQASLASLVLLGWLGVTVQGGTVAVLAVAVVAGLAGEALGLCVSAFARSEFQAVQFLPALVFPQLLTCGLFVPRDQMAGWLQGFAQAMPLTYIVEAMKRATTEAGWSAGLKHYVVIVLLYAGVALVASALTLRRQS